ncbi:MAG: hypothetical protein GTN80_10375 [Nitrososphaeria archaeon]|nr:hypothetical protein [Nitrososphaeria archaeon]NIN53516.1 hypothetical protein [Nitrososphaeria archaeon]NIQ34027.1 hypothetical protein [Nitrososphaeria archaeon]
MNLKTASSFEEEWLCGQTFGFDIGVEIVKEMDFRKTRRTLARLPNCFIVYSPDADRLVCTSEVKMCEDPSLQWVVEMASFKEGFRANRGFICGILEAIRTTLRFQLSI